MNKKLLFATVALAALTACTNDEIENVGGKNVAEGTSPVQFEVINNVGGTRASMGGTDNNTISWSAKQGDLFTLYFGASTAPYKSGYDNATYTAKAEEGESATLTTPTMIKEGEAIMVWPVDTTFRIKTGDALTIKIPVEQVNTADEIPYVSDRIKIVAYTGTKHKTADYNTAGYDRKYPIYMRPMASQLNLKADYAGTDATLKELEEGEDGITPIKVTSIDLLTKETGGTTLFTKEIPVKFYETANTAWTAVENNAFSAQTQFDVDNIADGGKTAKLTAKDKCLLPNNVGAKILILPQANIAAPGVDEGAVVVNTIYGKVVVAPNGVQGSKYKATPVDEAADAWARYIKASTVKETYETKATTAEADGENKGKYKTTSSIAEGMMQTINAFSKFTAPTGTKVIAGEDMGTAVNRYVKVLLTHLDMSDLHIKTDKQLRDVVRVWKKMGLDPVTVILDGDANKEFEISQKTIKVINDINGAYDAVSNPTQSFTVKACTKTGEECEKIVVTGASDIDNVQDMAFITYNGSKKVQVDLKAGETWKYKGLVKVEKNAVNRIRNYGTMVNSETATLQTAEFDGSANNIPLVNYGTWNITAGTLNVKFGVYNRATVNIAKGAQYREDAKEFENCADAIPSRFVGGDDTQIGVINNKGVFATVNGGKINNYGLIEHDDPDAKTYITSNQKGGKFNKVFSGSNKMGRINLPFSNKDEDNISISAAADQGFVSVTVTKEELAKAGVTSTKLNAGTVGTFVNYMIVNSGIDEIEDMPTQVKYVEIADKANTEIAWNVTTAQSYTGLIVLSPVNIKLGTSISATVTYLGADMFVAGTFNKAATVWDGYYGDTSSNVATKYVYFGE